MAIKELREKIAPFKSAVQALVDAAKAEERELTDDEAVQVDEYLAEIERLKAELEMAENLEARHNRLSAVLNDDNDDSERKTQAITVYDRREDDPRCGYRDLGEFAQSVISAAVPGGEVDDRLEIAAAASGMSAGVGSDGGWTMPPAFAATIWDGLNTGVGSLLDLTDRYTVEGDSLVFLANAETSRATGSRYGGVRGYWLAEADQITSSTPKVRRMKLEPQELGVLVYVTNKLLRGNAVALDQYLSRAMIEEINFLVGDAVINGNGAGKPLGLLNSGSLVTVAKETGQAADTFNQENIAKMWARLHVRSMSNAVWLINQDVLPQLDLLVTNVKNVAGTENVGGFNAQLFDPATMTIKGRPVIPVEWCATLGDKGDVILADLSGYAVGTQGGIESAMSIHLRFDYAETAFRVMFAIDGKPWLASALTPYKGSNTLTTHVALAARA